MSGHSILVNVGLLLLLSLSDDDDDDQIKVGGSELFFTPDNFTIYTRLPNRRRLNFHLDQKSSTLARIEPALSLARKERLR